MEDYDREFWQLSDQLRLQNNLDSNNSDRRNNNNPLLPPAAYDDSTAAGRNNKLAFGTTNHADRYNTLGSSAFPRNKNTIADPLLSYCYGYGLGSGFPDNNNNKTNNNNNVKQSYFNKSVGRPATANNNHNLSVDAAGKKKKSASSSSLPASEDKMRYFKSLPASESLPRGEAVGGYIFVCNNETMEENLKRRLFGLPSRYRDSVRAIRPGLPLFLYNYSTHQLHGIFEAASFGGSNIDPKAWEDSRFPAQVRVATRKICEPLEEDAFRPILHHYDGPKFRLELSVPEAVSLLDIFAEKVFA